MNTDNYTWSLQHTCCFSGTGAVVGQTTAVLQKHRLQDMHQKHMTTGVDWAGDSDTSRGRTDQCKHKHTRSQRHTRLAKH